MTREMVPLPTPEELNFSDITAFDVAVERRQVLKKFIDEAETEVAKIDNTIGLELDLAGAKNVNWRNQYEVIRREGNKGRVTLDRILLLEAGVSPEQISRGTKVGPVGKCGISVRKIGSKEYGEE